MQKIILATHNLHKMEEMKSILNGKELTIITLNDFPEIGAIPETGITLEENALIKARTVNQKTGLPAIGDDTGLEVDALAGAPGVYSSRFAGEHATFQDNVQRLLLEMKHQKNRAAQFRTVIAFADGHFEKITEGSIKGVIANQPRGTHGFGYDPVFFLPEIQRTFAELLSEEKNKISHRGIALQKLRTFLNTYWGE